MTRLQKITFNILLLVIQLNLYTCKPCIRTLCNTYSSFCGNRDCWPCSNLNGPYCNPYCNCKSFIPNEEPCGNLKCNSNCFQCSYDPTCNIYSNGYDNPGCYCERCNNQYLNPTVYGYDTLPQPSFDSYNSPYWQPAQICQQPQSNQPPIIIINDDDDDDDRCLTDDILGLLLTSLFNNNNNAIPPPPPNPSNCRCCNCNNNNCNCGNGCNNSNDNNCNSGNKCSTTVQITIVLPKSDNATKPSINIS
ncbi:GATA zinc finger domain-containing protein 12-like [Spodoptera litura]|uniref:GATA zinc finger domain-containing protein 12-like n=1 Tax=Spodoptera litura TaxID=69820 RepID=A0A9J7EAT9_SPOLT|nr:GATA zinc finger domain-containing protein 12-like [Spodoptera litura]